MWKRSVVGLLAGTVMTCCALLPAGALAQDPPRRVILIIGDGAGASYWTAAAYAQDALAVERLPVGGLVNTRSADDKITDSAAGATAYASGVRTFNGAIGMDPDSNAVTTVLELAHRNGLATGLVATSSITHATPAAFASHVLDRDMEFEIARQLVAADVDVLMGGGRGFFHPDSRPDSVDLLSQLRARYAYVETGNELAALQTGETQRLVGLFATWDPAPAAERVPTLPEMTRAALEVLDHDPDGFFLMVEGSQPDWRGHDREPLSLIVAEMLDLDRAVDVAMEYQAKHPETLIVVTADHETGGLGIQQASASRLLARAAQAADTLSTRLTEARSAFDPDLTALADSASWYMERLTGLMRRRARVVGDTTFLVARYSSGSHTAQMVPLFASGPGAEEFGGMKENWEIGVLLKALVSR